MVDSSEALTPAPATGFPVVVSGGQVNEHSRAFAHVSLLRGSFENSYSVKPEAVTRSFPRLVRASLTLALLAACAAGAPVRALAPADALTLTAPSRAAPSRMAPGSLVVRFTI